MDWTLEEDTLLTPLVSPQLKVLLLTVPLPHSKRIPDPGRSVAIDRWFEDLQHYEATLEEMAAASLDANFKEELSAIEQWFRVLSEAERTAALYSLLQSSTQVQMRFFVTVLQQMARNDPVAAGLMSPAPVGQGPFPSLPCAVARPATS